MSTPSSSLQSIWALSSTESSESDCSVPSTRSSVGPVVEVEIVNESSTPDSELVGAVPEEEACGGGDTNK